MAKGREDGRVHSVDLARTFAVYEDEGRNISRRNAERALVERIKGRQGGSGSDR